MEHVAALAQGGEVGGGVVARIMVEMRTGEDDKGRADPRVQGGMADGGPPAAIGAPSAALAVPPSPVTEMRDPPEMRSPAAFATGARAYEADRVRQLIPVDRIEPAVLGADRHPDSMNQERVAAKRYVPPSAKRSAPANGHTARNQIGSGNVAASQQLGGRLFILHLALGGCLKAPPVDYGITADTGGHIAYVLDVARVQGRQADVERVSVVTWAFEDARLGAAHGRACEPVDARVTIDRIATPCPAYLEKEALAAELPAFTEGFCAHLAALPRLPDVIHAHFADAAAVARVTQARFGIPFVYTPHALGIDKRAHGLGCDEGRILSERAAIAGAAAIVAVMQEAAYDLRVPRVSHPGRG